MMPDGWSTTSSRRIADNLGMTPGTAARALTRLRALGLVSHTRRDGAAGRFGLSAYVLGPVPGLDVVDPADTPAIAGPPPPPPRPALPHIDDPRVLDAHMAEAAPPGSAAGHSARGSLHGSAVAAPCGALDDPLAEERARFTAGSPARRGRTLGARPVAAQLSILDDTSGSELDTDPGR